jgi:hypothetical protein
MRGAQMPLSARALLLRVLRATGSSWGASIAAHVYPAERATTNVEV